MIILLFLIPLSVLLASGFLAVFVWAVRSGQYDDTCTPALRPLFEDESRCASEKAAEGNPPQPLPRNERTKIAKDLPNDAWLS